MSLPRPATFPAPPRLIVLSADDDLVRVIAEALVDTRHIAGLSQRQLATRAGVGHSMIAAYESGRRHPPSARSSASSAPPAWMWR
jgi:predicted transcriptional regulator